MKIHLLLQNIAVVAVATLFGVAPALAQHPVPLRVCLESRNRGRCPTRTRASGLSWSVHSVRG